ncbi:hypothetical protein KSC_048010 [Ktedonobacter sp. SOSP1-52]|uniref:hypothetical protein n=1 Tax=Ktedonobacter sp. SOSP1-52 TaxID=2778366 RepID=UPI0019158ABD|nr:hypothetical protein [Ktedonobacter sp. SOSP1-52]GHO65909.1 hypothetical protein KSC_048010 [Ktedonobacter sp. SOSP1-52]
MFRHAGKDTFDIPLVTRDEALAVTSILNAYLNATTNTPRTPEQDFLVRHAIRFQARLHTRVMQNSQSNEDSDTIIPIAPRISKR